MFNTSNYHSGFCGVENS